MGSWKHFVIFGIQRSLLLHGPKICWGCEATLNVVFLIWKIYITLKRRKTLFLKKKLLWAADFPGARGHAGRLNDTSELSRRSKMLPSCSLLQWHDLRAVKLGLALLKTLWPLRKGREGRDQTTIQSIIWSGTWPTFSALCAGLPKTRPGVPCLWRCQLDRENSAFRDLYSQSSLCQGPHDTNVLERTCVGAGQSFRDHPGRVNQWCSAWGPCSQMAVKFWICYSLTLQQHVSYLTALSLRFLFHKMKE